MLRRQLTILFPAVAIVAATWLTPGCSAVDDNDVAARVDDNELSNDVLTELVGVVGTPDDITGIVDPANGSDVRSAIQLWVQVELTAAGLDAAGTPVTAAESEEARGLLEEQLPNFADLSEPTVDTLVKFVSYRDVVGAMADPATFYSEATANSTVYIDPRFGEFLPIGVSVAPLGLPSVVPPADGVADPATG